MSDVLAILIVLGMGIVFGIIIGMNIADNWWRKHGEKTFTLLKREKKGD